MELVEHGSLDDFIEQQKRLPEEQVLETEYRPPRAFARLTPKV